MFIKVELYYKGYFLLNIVQFNLWDCFMLQDLPCCIQSLLTFTDSNHSVCLAVAVTSLYSSLFLTNTEYFAGAKTLEQILLQSLALWKLS